MRLGVWLVGFVCVVALVLWASSAFAAGISLCNLCSGYTISKRADGAVIIRCPIQATPLFVLKDCRNPAVTRTATAATITCR